MGPLIPLFWTSGDVCPGFQSKGGSLVCFLTCVILRFTSGVTPADCIEVSMAAKPFRSRYLQTCPSSIGGNSGIKPMTVHATCSKHSTVNHSATLVRLTSRKLCAIALAQDEVISVPWRINISWHDITHSFSDVCGFLNLLVRRYCGTGCH